jgi:hypothetical protein
MRISHLALLAEGTQEKQGDAPLAAAHHEAGESILEDLLKAEAGQVGRRAGRDRVSGQLRAPRAIAAREREHTHNLRIDRLTVGCRRRPPLYGPRAELNCEGRGAEGGRRGRGEIGRGSKNLELSGLS